MQQAIAPIFASLLVALAAVLSTAATDPAADSDLTAIDILLNPDGTMLEQAKAANAQLLKDYPQGFALDAEHTPHITCLQTCVYTKDLDKVYAAVEKVVATHKPIGMQLKTTGYYYIPWKGLGLAGITVAPTPELLDYQQAIIKAVAPFMSQRGTTAAYVPNPDGSPINDLTIDYVNTFIPKHVGKNFGPHVTIGLAHEAYLNDLKASPYRPFTFKIAGASIYHLGNFGTAQKRLWSKPD